MSGSSGRPAVGGVIPLPPVTTRRLISVSYDSVAQRDALATITDHVPDVERARRLAQASLIGRMRFDHILSGELVLTDAQAFDGPLFLVGSPKTVRAQLDYPDLTNRPLTVKMRKPSVAECLVAMVNDEIPGHGRVAKPFEFSIVRNETVRRDIYNELRERKKREEPGPESTSALLDMFAEQGTPANEVAEIESNWTEWDSEIMQDRVHSELWKGQFDLARAADEASTFLVDIAHVTRNLGAGESLHAERESREAIAGLKRAIVDHGIVNRTDLRRHIEEQELDQTANHDANVWLELVYALAIRNQHACEDAEFVNMRPLPAVDTRNRTIKLREQIVDLELSSVLMPSDYYLRLAHFEGPQLQAWARQYRETLDAWRNESAGHKAIEAMLASLRHQLSEGRVGSFVADVTGDKSSADPEKGSPTPSKSIIRYRGRFQEWLGTNGVGVAGTAIGLELPPMPDLALTISAFAIPWLWRRALGSTAIVTDIADDRRRMGLRREEVAPT